MREHLLPPVWCNWWESPSHISRVPTIWEDAPGAILEFDDDDDGDSDNHDDDGDGYHSEGSDDYRNIVCDSDDGDTTDVYAHASTPNHICNSGSHYDSLCDMLLFKDLSTLWWLW